MTTVTESGGRQNIYSIEPRPQVDPNYQGYPLEAEKANGRWAMLGFVALLGAYITTGQIIPGIFKETWMKINSQFTITQRYKLMTPEAERFNGWAAMLGFVAAVGAYVTTGQIIPGIF